MTYVNELETPSRIDNDLICHEFGGNGTERLVRILRRISSDVNHKKMALDLRPQVTIKCITCVANHCQRRFPRVRLKERRSSRGLYTLLQRQANLGDGEKYFTETMYLLQQPASACRLSLTSGNRLSPTVSYPLPKCSRCVARWSCSCVWLQADVSAPLSGACRRQDLIGYVHDCKGQCEM